MRRKYFTSPRLQPLTEVLFSVALVYFFVGSHRHEILRIDGIMPLILEQTELQSRSLAKKPSERLLVNVDKMRSVRDVVLCIACFISHSPIGPGIQVSASFSNFLSGEYI